MFRMFTQAVSNLVYGDDHDRTLTILNELANKNVSLPKNSLAETSLMQLWHMQATRNPEYKQAMLQYISQNNNIDQETVAMLARAHQIMKLSSHEAKLLKGVADAVLRDNRNPNKIFVDTSATKAQAFGVLLELHKDQEELAYDRSLHAFIHKFDLLGKHSKNSPASMKQELLALIEIDQISIAAGLQDESDLHIDTYQYADEIEPVFNDLEARCIILQEFEKLIALKMAADKGDRNSEQIYKEKSSEFAVKHEAFLSTKHSDNCIDLLKMKSSHTGLSLEHPRNTAIDGIAADMRRSNQLTNRH